MINTTNYTPTTANNSSSYTSTSNTDTSNQEFSSMMSTMDNSETNVQSSEINKTSQIDETISLEQALANFHEIHQRAQITGVPTAEYNKAVEDLGIDTSDSFSGIEAINLLKSNGYSTDFPSKEAVLKYGNTDQDHGNRTYMKGNDNYPTGAMFTKAQDNTYDAYVDELKTNVQIESAMQTTSSPETTIESEIPTPIISDDITPLSSTENNDNTEIQKNEVISTLELLMSNTNIVSNNLSSDLQDIINKLEEDK